MSIPMNQRTDIKYFQTRHDTGIYEYRGFMIWKDAARDGWSIGEQSIGPFPTLKEAKKHVDRTIKYPHLRNKIACQKQDSDTSNSPHHKS